MSSNQMEKWIRTAKRIAADDKVKRSATKDGLVKTGEMCLDTRIIIDRYPAGGGYRVIRKSNKD